MTVLHRGQRVPSGCPRVVVRCFCRERRARWRVTATTGRRGAEGGRHLAVAQAFEVAHDEGLGGARVEAREAVAQGAAKADAAGLALGRGRGVGKGIGRRVVERHRGAGLAAAQGVEGGVGGRAPQVGARLVAPDAAGVAVGEQSQEDRLHHVLGVALAAGDAERGLEDVAAVDAEELFELGVGAGRWLGAWGRFARVGTPSSGAACVRLRPVLREGWGTLTVRLRCTAGDSGHPAGGRGADPGAAAAAPSRLQFTSGAGGRDSTSRRLNDSDVAQSTKRLPEAPLRRPPDPLQRPPSVVVCEGSRSRR